MRCLEVLFLELHIHFCTILETRKQQKYLLTSHQLGDHLPHNASKKHSTGNHRCPLTKPHSSAPKQIWAKTLSVCAICGPTRAHTRMARRGNAPSTAEWTYAFTARLRAGCETVVARHEISWYISEAHGNGISTSHGSIFCTNRL